MPRDDDAGIQPRHWRTSVSRLPASFEAFVEELLYHRGELGIVDQEGVVAVNRVDGDELGIGAGWVVICGMAMGYADPDAVINTFQPPRIEVDEYAVFLD